MVALIGGAALGVNLVGPGESHPQDVWIAQVVMGLACLALLIARDHPRSAVVVTTSAAVVTGGLGYLLTPLLLAPVMVALYWLAVAVRPRTSRVYGGLATVAVVGTAVGVNFDESVALRVIGPALWLVLPLVMGSRSRLRHAWLEAVRARAEHAERNREEEARLRVTEERMRIARDLHDVVAHHMAVANAQAGTAGHLLDSNPALTKKILADLQATTSSVMLELRDTVGVLRRTGAEEEDLEPAPGLGRLPDLLEGCRSAGLVARVEIRGKPRDIPPVIDLTAYRIIQEALTNATKHSGAGAASLCLDYSTTTLTITVTNDIRTDGEPEIDHDGYGIIGMRERARAVGGDLRVSDREAGRFEVVASLPLHLRGSTP